MLRVLLVALFVACAACSSPSAGTKLDIVAGGYSYDPASIALDAHTIAVAIGNQGQVEHDFELIGSHGVVAHIEAIQPGPRGMTGTLAVH